ncbi:MBL fold metallo-hydrolase [Hymenobacter sediminis]|uniref:MBL fold metallo-hydrolase n=1 Tax=Hymenobacter sediminis TaxID=2218621 RepID=UPI000DA6B1CE|nr:MBL fold metallo-hydrolase [Hymenobacter sediminis]RPD44299.1 MBL fold metallo-hydrolase [Hymenobacter sediminis]
MLELSKHRPAPAYPVAVGDVHGCILSDGPLDLGLPEKAFLGETKQHMEQALTSHFLPTDRIVVEQNVLFFSLGNTNVLVETGVGSFRGFGEGAGQLVDNLRAAGIEPARIDAILCSHPHPDHVGGLCKADGQPTFPNASIYLAEHDFAYWTDEALLDSWAAAAIRVARATLLPLRERLIFIQDGEEFLPGVKAHFTPGHTAEHICFEVSSGNDSLFLLGDVAHHAVMSLESPLLNFAADLAPSTAARTRTRVFSTLADERTRVLGYHFPWPGLGHLARQGEGFRLVPDSIRW